MFTKFQQFTPEKLVWKIQKTGLPTIIVSRAFAVKLWGLGTLLEALSGFWWPWIGGIADVMFLLEPLYSFFCGKRDANIGHIISLEY